MPSDSELKQIFNENRIIAVVGMSRSTEKPARRIPAFLMKKGYSIIPVNPSADKIIGRKSYANLGEIPDPIDMVEVFRPSEEALGIVKDAVARRKTRGDINAIWLQQGITSEEGKKLAEEAGIQFVQDRCMHIEYMRLIGK